MKLLVTGAAGYIGAHFVKCAVECGHEVIATDYNWNQNDLSRYTSEIIDWDFTTPNKLGKDVDKIVHIGAQNKVPKSMRDPWLYYHSNIMGTKNVVDFAECDHFVYCSTGSAFNPAANPYAMSKYAGEVITKQFCPKHSIVRFYNVSGNDQMYKFDDEYSHLIRRAAATANGKFDKIYLYGCDYDTRDGTCIRNYTHVTDIVESLERIVSNDPTGEIDCLGAPEGVSVKEVLDTMSNISKKNIQIEVADRREGDIAISTVPTKSIHFKQTKTLEDMCYDALRYEQ